MGNSWPDGSSPPNSGRSWPGRIRGKTPETLAAGGTARAAGASLEKVADAAVTGCKRPGLSSGRGGKRQDSNGAQGRRRQLHFHRVGRLCGPCGPIPWGAYEAGGHTGRRTPSGASANQQAGPPTVRPGLSVPLKITILSQIHLSIHPSRRLRPARRPSFDPGAGTDRRHGPQEKDCPSRQDPAGCGQAGRKPPPTAAGATQAQERMKSAARHKLAGQARQTASRRGCLPQAGCYRGKGRGRCGQRRRRTGRRGHSPGGPLCCHSGGRRGGLSLWHPIFRPAQGAGSGPAQRRHRADQCGVCRQAGGAQAGDYDSIQLQGQPPDWRQVLAVFACKTAGTDDGVDVTVLDPDRVERLRAVFWDMTVISSQVETIDHPGSGEG